MLLPKRMEFNNSCPVLLVIVFLPFLIHAQSIKQATSPFHHLIDQYSLARENKDTVLLKSILTTDIDQLVSTGEWRRGLPIAVQGMMRSSAARPGTRKLIVETVKILTPKSAIVDARYEIENEDGSIRKMWSSFIVIQEKKKWKIASIRNMLPSPN